MTSLYTVKDKILTDLNAVADHNSDFLKLAKRVLDALQMTDGLWKDLGYAYKAREICDRIAMNASRLKTLTTHHSITLNLQTIYMEACFLSDHFHRLQMDSFCDAMGVEDERTREIAKMTNMELAS